MNKPTSGSDLPPGKHRATRIILGATFFFYLEKEINTRIQIFTNTQYIFSFSCASFIGRTGSRQDIYLAPGCWTRAIVAHEIGKCPAVNVLV